MAVNSDNGGRADAVGREAAVEYIRAGHDVRHALVISDPQPVSSAGSIWTSAGSGGR